MNSNPPIVVVEDDAWTRLIGVVLDPATSQERRTAFADFMSPDEPDFAGWCEKLRARAGALYPSEVRLVRSEAELRVNLAPAREPTSLHTRRSSRWFTNTVRSFGTSMSRPAPPAGSRFSASAGAPISPVQSMPSR
jgi:mRNA-degrading endonuclease toxin of MazEF toxin-antitoxin module